MELVSLLVRLLHGRNSAYNASALAQKIYTLDLISGSSEKGGYYVYGAVLGCEVDKWYVEDTGSRR